MKAAWYDSYGTAEDVLRYSEQPEPHAGRGEVRIRLHVSAVNPADTVLRRCGGQPSPPIIPNSDGAGVVDEVGPGVTRFVPGQRVWLYNGQRNGRSLGTAAEYIAIDENLVTALPDDVSFEHGATLGIPCMTGWVCLFMDGPIHGQTVLVTGGAGAVGHYAIQLAKWGGAQVVTTVSSPAKAEIARLAGADLVINYKTGQVAQKVLEFTGGRGANRVVEVDFGANLETSLQALMTNGAIATYASTVSHPTMPFDIIKGKNITIHALRLPLMPRPICQAARADIIKWLHAGKRIHQVAGVHPLRDIVAAHKAVEAGNKLGTVLVDCLAV